MKNLKSICCILKRNSYYYLAKLYESSNHFFSLESKQGTRKKYEALNSFQDVKRD